MTAYDEIKKALQAAPRIWLVTGVSGFIGSNLLEALLELDQKVVGLDNFSTGKNATWDVKAIVSHRSGRISPSSKATFVISRPARRLARCRLRFASGCLGIGACSIEDPLNTNESNVTGFLNMLGGSRSKKTLHLCASSSTYGDHPGLPKVEEAIGRPLSPYAVTKYVNELYADVFGRCYGVECTGLRYFNVFGPRQDPEGAYAAVIPKWIAAMIRNEPIDMNGDGETSRDFCYVENAVQANLLAAAITRPEGVGQVYNVALNQRTTLNQLFHLLQSKLVARRPSLVIHNPVYRGFRAGDVRHSQADIGKAQRLLGYAPTHTVEQGLDAALDWFIKDVGQESVAG